MRTFRDCLSHRFIATNAGDGNRPGTLTNLPSARRRGQAFAVLWRKAQTLADCDELMSHVQDAAQAELILITGGFND